VVKRNKSTKDFHEYLLATTYMLMSILMAHPSMPPLVGNLTLKNEGHKMRNNLKRIGIPTPGLISLTDDAIVEEFVEGGNLYQAFRLEHEKEDSIRVLAFQAGILTARMHNAGYVFTDNKSQNYLVTIGNRLVRTDLGFINRTKSIFAQSMDIASFLASVIDFGQSRYEKIEEGYYGGYRSEASRGFPYLSIILRNILSLGFASNTSTMLQNISKRSKIQTTKEEQAAEEEED
jgi:tRNA A-37 threonylcarbamoyl transferase component Bud32